MAMTIPNKNTTMQPHPSRLTAATSCPILFSFCLRRIMEGKRTTNRAVFQYEKQQRIFPMKLSKYAFFIFLLFLFVPPIFAEETKRTCIGLLWCSEEKDGASSVDALLYLYSSEEREYFSRLAIRPFYSHEINRKLDYTRRSILWPLGTYEEKKGELQFHIFPLYWQGKGDDYQYRYILPFYGSDQNEKRARRFFFPFYGHEETKNPPILRTSFLGLPPIDSLQPLPTLALYEQTQSNEMRTNRFFPLYRYERELKKEALRFSLIGSHALSLFWYNTESALTENHVFPLYSYEKNRTKQEIEFGLLGYNALSLIWHKESPSLLENRFFPLYDYQEKGEKQSLSVIGFSDLAVYRHIKTPTQLVDRLFPLYHYRRDLQTDETEWDIALLYNHLNTPTTISNRFFPLYHYERKKQKDQWELGLIGFSPFSIYSHRATPALTTDHLFPLYGYWKSFPDETRFSALGLPPIGHGFTWALYEQTQTPSITQRRLFPLFRYYYNKETDLLRWDALFIYQHQKTPTYIKNAFLPFYFYENDLDQKRLQIGAIGAPPFTLFSVRQSPEKTTDYFFPFYSHQKTSDYERHAALGYDFLSLYFHERKNNAVTDRFFPIYGYNQDRFGTDLNVMLIYNHEKRFQNDFVHDSLFPLYSFEKTESQSDFSLIGYKAFSLMRYTKTPDLLHHRFFPLYDLEKAEAQLDFSLIGYKAFSFLRYAKTPDHFSHHIFPLYRYDHDLKKDERLINAMLLYSHRASPNRVSDRLFPIYDYQAENNNDQSLSLLGVSKFALYRHVTSPTKTEDRVFLLYRYTNEKTTGKLQISALGIAPLSLYAYRSTPTKTESHLFPLYRYESNHNQSDFSLLWPLVHYRREEGRVTQASIFWWLAHYEEIKKGEKEFRMLGGSAMAVLRKKKTPTVSSFELNPIIPFYSYTKKENDFEWNFLGGLLGMRTVGTDKKVRLFYRYW